MTHKQWTARLNLKTRAVRRALRCSNTTAAYIAARSLGFELCGAACFGHGVTVRALYRDDSSFLTFL